MKAAVCTKAGAPEVIQFKDVIKPNPQADEILVKVHASTVTGGDALVRNANWLMWIVFHLLMGKKKPKTVITGQEYSGEIEAIGEQVKSFKPGDKVFGSTGLLGANAEYICVSERDAVTKLPNNMNFREASCIPFGGNTALYFLRTKGKISKGQKVLIYGASGGVGTAAVQLAKAFETEVTGVCSEKNTEMVKSLGATKVMDYKKEDFSKLNEQYDVIFDAVGKTSHSKVKTALKSGGIFVSVKKGLAKERKEDLDFLRELIEKDKFRVIIDKQFPLSDIVEAHRYVDAGHKKGNVVININEANQP